MATKRTLDPAARLRLARESKGLSCREIADTTKLSTRAIEALETGRLSVLPAGIYRRAIVRTVAAEVGLDPEQMLREFASAFPDDLPAPEDPRVVASPVPVRPSIQRAMAITGMIVPLLGGIGYFAWPDRSASVETAATPSRPVAAQNPEVIPAGGFHEAPSEGLRPVTITLTISSRCHLRIIADGQELLGRLVEPGETVPIELGDELVLSGDNASAVQFSINGQAGRQLGAPGDALSVRIARDDYESFLVRY